MRFSLRIIKVKQDFLSFKFPRATKNLFILHCCFVGLLCLIHLGLHCLDFRVLAKNPQNFFDHALILTSFDAYHYAKGVREFLELGGISFFLEHFDEFSPLVVLGGIFAKGFGLDFVLSFGSVFFSVLTILALYLFLNALLGRLVDSSRFLQLPLRQILAFLSFLGSLVGLLLPSFYQRVGVGYFDTDMLLLAFPLLTFYFLICFERASKLYDLFFLGFFGYCAVSWHNGVQNLLLLGLLFFIFLELFFAIKTRKVSRKSIAIICVFLIVLTPSHFCLIALILFVMFFKIFPRILGILFALSLFYALYFGLFDPVLSQFQAYFFGGTHHAKKFIFFPVVASILETMPISLEVLVARSGGIFIFALGILGFLLFLAFSGFLLFFQFKTNCATRFSSIVLFLLPFCFLGFISLKIGARFTLFLMPIIALGFAVLSLWLLLRFHNFFVRIFPSFCVVILIACLDYEIPSPILSQQEINAFKALDSKLSGNDFIFSWWDYGYALRYFTKAQILLDGGRHSGAVNYPIAKILLSNSPTFFYNFSLLLAQKLQTLPQKSWNQVFETIFFQENFKDVDSFFSSLSAEIQPKTLENQARVYWVLPLRILPLLANLNAFANLNVENGKPIAESFFTFSDSTTPPLISPKRIINVYEDFYLSLRVFAKNLKDSTLTQINFGKNSFLLSEDYLRSNLIQMLIFRKNPPFTCVSGDFVRIYELKERECVESRVH